MLGLRPHKNYNMYACRPNGFCNFEGGDCQMETWIYYIFPIYAFRSSIIFLFPMILWHSLAVAGYDKSLIILHFGCPEFLTDPNNVNMQRIMIHKSI